MTPLLLLHGALGAAEQMMPLQNLLAADHSIFKFDFPGHGHSAKDTGTFSIKDFAADTIRFMDENDIAQADIFGYSMGGFLGMYLGQEYPRRIRKIATLGTKYLWDAEYARSQQKMLDADVIELKVPAFAAVLAVRHASKNWKSILQKTAAMMTGLGGEATLLARLSAMEHPALLMVGDEDNTVSVSETETVMRGIKNGRLAVLPGTPHPLEKVNLPLLSLLLKNFFG